MYYPTHLGKSSKIIVSWGMGGIEC